MQLLSLSYEEAEEEQDKEEEEERDDCNLPEVSHLSARANLDGSHHPGLPA